MEKVAGRCDDMIIVRGVNVFPSQIEEIVLRTPGVAPHFQLELSKHGRLDRLTVRAEARPDAAGDAGGRERAAALIVRGVKEGVGVTVEVRIEDPDTLERSAGKLQRLKDLRQL
jgi:phenylacetate-CoA ligase